MFISHICQYKVHDHLIKHQEEITCTVNKNHSPLGWDYFLEAAALALFI